MASSQPVRKAANADLSVQELESLPVPPNHDWVAIALWRIGIMTSFLTFWELSSRYWIDPFWFSSPLAIGTRLASQIQTGSLWGHLQVTLLEMALGFVAGSVLGVMVGLLLGLKPRLAKIVDPFIIGIYSLPKIALAPLFILWLGVGLQSKVALVTLVVFFLVFYNTYSGVLSVDRELIDVLRLMKARRNQIISKVILPSAVIWIFTGMKISVPYALIGAVVGEMMASNRGIGYLIQASAGQFDTTGVFAALVVLLIISLVLHGVIKRVERAVLHWQN